MLKRTGVAIGAALVAWSLAAAPASQGTGGLEQDQAAEKTAKKEPHRVLGDIPFSYSYPETLTQARLNGRPILAYFTFDT